MEKIQAEVNGQKISIGVKIIENKENFRGIANVNFGWFEVVGFRISYFKDYIRRNDCLRVEPPKFGFRYTEAFRTTVAIVDPIERDRVRKEYWYKLEDAIIDAYYWSLDIDGSIKYKSEPKKEENLDDEINLDDLPL